MLEALKNNPVRIYAVATAALALVAYYVPDIPQGLVLALVAAVLGLGETVRAQVTPSRKVVGVGEVVDRPFGESALLSDLVRDDG
jgi:hypothetical protein